jgi:hypothetical protein
VIGMARIRFSLAVLCALAVVTPAFAQKKKAKQPAAEPEPAAATESCGDDADETASSATGGVCIAPDASKAVSTCPSNMGKAKGKIAGAPKS